MARSVAGRMRRRVSIEAASESRDAHGGVVPVWSAVCAAWAEVEPLRGRPVFLAGRHGAEITHAVRLRYRDGIGPRMRVRFRDRLLTIDSVIDENEANRMLVLLCREAA